MDQRSREIIRQNEKLLKNLDVRKLEPFLRKSKIFTNSMLKDILNADSSYNLYSELSTRGPNAYSKFLQILEEAGFENEVLNLKQTSNFHSMSNYVEIKTDYDFYSMNTVPVGCCLIINNVKFEKLNKNKGDEKLNEKVESELKGEEKLDEKLEDREGSDVDASNLRRFFKKLKYEVIETKDLKGIEMKRCLETFSKDKFLKQVSCCFIIILSHGGKLPGSEMDVIYGTDAVPLKKNDIYDIFKNENCEFLKNKPKVFIFQACRGRNEDWGFYSKVSFDSSKYCKYPSLNDVLVVHSALPNHKSYRDHDHGTWLVQDLLSVFSEYYTLKPLMQMLNAVGKKIQERLSQNGECKQVIHKEDFGLRADIHICSNDEYQGCDVAVRNYI